MLFAIAFISDDISLRLREEYTRSISIVPRANEPDKMPAAPPQIIISKGSVIRLSKEVACRKIAFSGLFIVAAIPCCSSGGRYACKCLRGHHAMAHR